MVEKKPVSVVEAVQADLDSFGADLAASGLAATALALAREIDSSGNSATSKSMCAKALLETMDRLRALAPPKETFDKLDELTRRREKRRAS